VLIDITQDSLTQEVARQLACQRDRSSVWSCIFGRKARQAIHVIADDSATTGQVRPVREVREHHLALVQKHRLHLGITLAHEKLFEQHDLRNTTFPFSQDPAQAPDCRSF